MARDSKQALSEAEGQCAISKITVPEETKNKLISDSKKTAIKMFLASLILLAVTAGIIFLFVGILHYARISIKIIVALICVLIFPFVSIHGIFSTFSAASKGDYDFYVGEVIGKTDKGYKIKGLEDQIITFPVAFKPQTDLAAGAQVKIFRLKNELSLFDF